MLTNRSLTNKKCERLEQALSGQPEIVKSRVYSLIVHWGIEPEDEFFVIFVAMGQLVALVEEAPKRFDSSFNNFTEGINIWTETNIQILNEIASKAQVTERLAGGAEKLAQSSGQLVQVCSELIIQLKKSNGTQKEFQSPPPTSEENYALLLKIVSQKLTKVEKLISNLQLEQIAKTEKAKPKKTKLNLNPPVEKQIWSFNLVLLGLLIFFCVSSFLSWRSMIEVHQKTNWLLEKANRRECLEGIKSPESIECTSLPSR